MYKSHTSEGGGLGERVWIRQAEERPACAVVLSFKQACKVSLSLSLSRSLLLISFISFYLFISFISFFSLFLLTIKSLVSSTNLFLFFSSLFFFSFSSFSCRYVYKVFVDAGWEEEGIKMVIFKDGVAGLSRLSPNVKAYDSYGESGDPVPPVIPPVDPFY